MHSLKQQVRLLESQRNTPSQLVHAYEESEVSEASTAQVGRGMGGWLSVGGPHKHTEIQGQGWRFSMIIVPPSLFHSEGH